MFELIGKTKNVSTVPQLNNNIELLAPYLALPICSLFGFISNAINIAVFLHPKMKDKSFKYMLAISVSHFLYSSLMIYAVFILCEDCAENKSYSLQIYKILIHNYFTSCLAIFGHFCEVTISMHRFFTLKNKRTLDRISYKLMISILFILSLLFYLSELFSYDIVSTTHCVNSTGVATVYSLAASSFGSLPIGKLLPMIQASIRVFITSILISSINIANLVELKKRFKKRILVKQKHKATLSIKYIYLKFFYQITY